MNRFKFFLSLLLLSLFGVQASGLSPKDSLLQSSPSNSPSQKIIQLIDLSRSYRDSSLVKSIEYGCLAINLAQNINDTVLYARACKHQGINYLYLGNLDSSLMAFSRAVASFKAADMRLDMGKVLGNIGIVYRRMGLYDKALEKYMEVIPIYEEEGYKKGLGTLYINIGGLYQQQQKLDMAELHFRLSLDEFRKFGRHEHACRSLNNLGVIYQGRKMYERSLEYFTEGLEENIEVGSKQLEAIFQMNIGLSYTYLRQYEKANKYYDIAESIRTKLSDQWGLVKVWVLQGKNYYYQGHYKQAFEYMNMAEKTARRLNMSLVMSEICHELSSFYEDQKNYKLALNYKKRGNHISDSLMDLSNNNRFRELEKKYEADKRKKDLELLAQKNQIQKLELSRKNAWLFGLIIAIILGVGAIAISFRLDRIKVKHRIMDLQQRVLLSQMNPHFLFNSLTSIQSFILDERNDEANLYLSQLACLVRAVLENSRQEFISLNNELQMLEDYLGLQNLRFENEFSYNFLVDPKIDKDEIAVPPMLAQPFIENSIKHGDLRNMDNAQISVKISLKEEDNILLYEIMDNGIGIDATMEQVKNSAHCSLATSIALDRVKLYNYHHPKRMRFEIIDLKHVDPKLHGTRVCFQIPFKRI